MASILKSLKTDHGESKAEALQDRAMELKEELKQVEEALKNLGENSTATATPNTSVAEVLPPPGKRGYLFKWQDRSIGWGGTKWALRYTSLDRGRICYYYSHLESAPRYVLSLRGCAVSDDGLKRNRRHTSKTTPRGTDPPLEEVGAYFFVFSVYQRPEDGNESDEAVPFLRFSTTSLAEKSQWIRLISEACAYCETDSFLKEAASRNAEEEHRRVQQMQMARAMPQAERGTLPPLYFAPTERKTMVRRPSQSKLPRPKLFRSKSKILDAEKTEKKGYPPSKPMHRQSAPSYLSEEASTQNYRGFFNLAIIILIVSNFRLVLASVRKHGFVLTNLRNLTNYSIETWNQFPFLTGMMALNLSLILAFFFEWGLARKYLHESVGMSLHQLNAHSSFAISVLIVWNFIEKPAIGACLLMNGAITWMKLISYALANEDYRGSMTKDGENSNTGMAMIDNLDTKDMAVEYPSNVTLWNMYYFWLAPTLTYQIAFPKTPRVRPLRVLGLLLRMAFTFSLCMFVVAQFVAPNLELLLEDLEESNGQYTIPMLGEYWLKLSIANTYIWLLVFYFYFHLWLNFFAELLRFGDRVFYKDWWNSGEVGAYWRLWNLPVHYWLVRHLYFPCVRHNFPKIVATFVVFFFSAVMHEVLISIPFHMLRPWSFLGMMFQIPLVVITKHLYRRYPGSSTGNILFWITFCVVGQPMAILLYTIDYKYAKVHDGQEPELFDLNSCRVMYEETCLIR